MTDFLRHTPDLSSYWRAIILFGANSATYKFALAQALLDVSENEQGRVALSDLAVPYSRHLLRHLEIEDRQGTAPSSSFLDASAKMARIASEWIDQPVCHERIETFEPEQPFDSIWASASLLHRPENVLPGLLKRAAGWMAEKGAF
jgi:hypothetical protein